MNTSSDQDMGLSTALMELSKNAILILTVEQTPGERGQIVQANARAHELIPGLTKPLIGSFIDQLPAPFNEPSLPGYLHQVLQETTPVRFQLVCPAHQSGMISVFDCQLIRVDGQRLALSLDLITSPPERGLLLEQVLETIPAGLIQLRAIRDQNQVIIDFQAILCNQLGADITGQSREVILTQPIRQRYPDGQVHDLLHRYTAIVTSGEPYHQLVRVPPQDTRLDSSGVPAETVWYDVSAVAVADGLIVTYLDITANKLAQLNLERQADLINGVLNSSKSGILVFEPIPDETNQIIDFGISLGNPASWRLFAPFLGKRFTSDAVLGNTMLTLFPAGKERAIFTALVAVVRSGQPIHDVIEYAELGLTYEYDITPFRTGVLVITTDITPLRVYQQQLEAKNIALSRSNEYLQQFAYVASHDLQEPLRKILSFGDLLLAQYTRELDAAGQDMLRRQQNAAQRMQILIKDLLDYSRLTTVQLPFQPVSLHTLTQEVLGDLETTIRSTSARITVGELPTLTGNETQLRQLLQNLIANALKFTKPGQPPQVRIDARLLPADQLAPLKLAVDQGPWIALSVADEGIGFDKSQGERIFDLFQRLHGRSQYTGTGIGLAVVRKVVENHRARITVESQPGAGATFTVYLPVA